MAGGRNRAAAVPLGAVAAGLEHVVQPLALPITARSAAAVTPNVSIHFHGHLVNSVAARGARTCSPGLGEPHRNFLLNRRFISEAAWDQRMFPLSKC